MGLTVFYHHGQARYAKTGEKNNDPELRCGDDIASRWFGIDWLLIFEAQTSILSGMASEKYFEFPILCGEIV
jgi:hypothetical protein